MSEINIADNTVELPQYVATSELEAGNRSDPVSPNVSGPTVKEIDDEDVLRDHPTVKNLRESMYNEAIQFLRQQRMSCMLAGAWFQIPPASNNPSSTGNVTIGSTGSSGSANSLKPAKPARWRFCKLSGTKKTLHWADFPEQFDKKPSFDQLNERLELSTVTDIYTGLASPIHGAVTSALTSNVTNANTSLSGMTHMPSIKPSPSSGSLVGIMNSYNAPPPAPTPPPPLSGNSTVTLGSNVSFANVSSSSGVSGTISIGSGGSGSVRGRRGAVLPSTVSSTDLSTLCLSLMSGPATSILDVICVTSTQFSEWTDGLNVLLSRNTTNRDSVEFIHSLTEIMVQLRLLDISADRLSLVEPNNTIPPLPPDVNFYYDDVAGIGELAPMPTMAPVISRQAMGKKVDLPKKVVGTDDTCGPRGAESGGWGPDSVEV